MCGRFTLVAPKEVIAQEFGVKADAVTDLKPRYNIAPSPTLELMQWGLVPSWSKEPKTNYSTINARAETLLEKPLYKGLLSGKRCIIPADSFFEWDASASPKQPWRFQLENGKVFGFAGLWDEWRSSTDSQTLKTFTIITCAANDLVKAIHPRMPVILERSNYNTWLDTTHQKDLNLDQVLLPFPPSKMKTYKVSLRLNSPRNDDETVITPIN